MTRPATQTLLGGLGAVRGLQLAGISAGFRKNPERRDLALIVAAPDSRAAGVFTQSAFAAAPVLLCREHLAAERQGAGFRALIINSGNANAATGAEGLETARKVCAMCAQALGCEPEQVLVASTGVIGVKHSLEPFVTGIPAAVASLVTSDGKGAQENSGNGKGAYADSGESAGVWAGRTVAEAIMTTDTRPKTAARAFVAADLSGGETHYTIGGMAKGSGMIAPHMGTMIAVLATDAPLEQHALEQALASAVGASFNCLTIDSDTSTNDCTFLIATGAAAGTSTTSATGGEAPASAPSAPVSLQPNAIDTAHPAYAPFVAVLTEVCQDLTYQLAQDGEGATKVIVVDVTGAATKHEAELAARAIADSPLVKTAIAGHDANWGRIAMALGKSGASFCQEDVSISIMDLEVFVEGAPQEFSEAEAARRFDERDEVYLAAHLGAGTAGTRIWTCDLTHEYISINGDYRS